MTDLGELTPVLSGAAGIWQSAALQQALVFLAALLAGLLVMTVAARLEVTPMSGAGRALPPTGPTDLTPRWRSWAPGPSAGSRPCATCWAWSSTAAGWRWWVPCGRRRPRWGWRWRWLP